jgi:carbonic anhydrase
MAHTTPAQAWTALKEGNERFVADRPEHPGQSREHRASLLAAQRPIAAVLGCADSRVSTVIVFDQGLGDLFVVRTAGQVIDSAVLGSIEYAVEVLDVPLVVVLGHNGCGAVRAGITALDGGGVPGGFIRDVVERVTPSIMLARRDGLTLPEEFEARHVKETAAQLLTRSRVIADRVERGRLAIVGATYQLSDGRIVVREQFGDIGETVSVGSE